MTTTSDADAATAKSGLLGRTFLSVCVVYSLGGFLIAPFSALFAVYVETDLKGPPSLTGFLKGLMLALGGIFAVFSGRLSDLVGRKTVLLIGLGGSVVTGLVFHAPNLGLLILLIVIIGIAMGPWSTAGQSYLITSVASRRLGLGSAVYFLSMTAGASLGAWVTRWAKQWWPDRETFPYQELGTAMTLAMAGLFVLALLFLPRGGTTQARPTARPRMALWPAYRPLLANADVHLLIGLRCCITTFWGMANIVMPLLVYRVSLRGSTADEDQAVAQAVATAADYHAVSLAVAACGQVLTGFLCDRFGRFWPLIVSAAGIVASAVALALTWHSLPCLFIFGTALSATAWAVSTLVPKLMNDIALPDQKNRLVGLMHLVWSSAMVTGSVVGGLLIQVNETAPFVAGAALATGGTICAWRLCLHLDRQGK